MLRGMFRGFRGMSRFFISNTLTVYGIWGLYQFLKTVMFTCYRILVCVLGAYRGGTVSKTQMPYYQYNHFMCVSKLFNWNSDPVQHRSCILDWGFSTSITRYNFDALYCLKLKHDTNHTYLTIINPDKKIPRYIFRYKQVIQYHFSRTIKIGQLGCHTNSN